METGLEAGCKLVGIFSPAKHKLEADLLRMKAVPPSAHSTCISMNGDSSGRIGA